MRFVCANVADRCAVLVAVGGAGESALIGGWAAVVVARVNGWAVRQQGMCQREAAVILQGTQPGVGVDAVAVRVESASVAAVQVIALGCERAFIAKTISVAVCVGNNGVFDCQRGGVLKDVAAGAGTAGCVAAEGGIQDEGIAAVVETAAVVAGAVAADGDVGQFHRDPKVFDAAAGSRLILGDRAVEQGEVAAVGDSAAGGLGGVCNDLALLNDGGPAVASGVDSAAEGSAIVPDHAVEKRQFCARNAAADDNPASAGAAAGIPILEGHAREGDSCPGADVEDAVGVVAVNDDAVRIRALDGEDTRQVQVAGSGSVFIDAGQGEGEDCRRGEGCIEDDGVGAAARRTASCGGVGVC